MCYIILGLSSMSEVGAIAVEVVVTSGSSSHCSWHMSSTLRLVMVIDDAMGLGWAVRVRVMGVCWHVVWT